MREVEAKRALRDFWVDIILKVSTQKITGRIFCYLNIYLHWIKSVYEYVTKECFSNQNQVSLFKILSHVTT